MQNFRSSGKLLLSGEYTVLRGAKAIATPTLLGQSLSFQPFPERRGLDWQALDHQGQVWLRLKLDQNLAVLSEEGPTDLVKRLLRFCFRDTLPQKVSGAVTTQLEFPGNWGLGSSSSLTHLIAQWTNTDLFPLYRSAFQGSGYDIFCAEAQAPIAYELKQEKPTIQKIRLPACLDQTYLVYLGQKMDSQFAVRDFQSKAIETQALAKISSLSEKLLMINDRLALKEWMLAHEQLTGRLLNQPPIGQRLFPTFKGCVKSLGAWGGDFVWVLPDHPDDMAYFEERGYHPILNFTELIDATYLQS